MLYSLYRTPVHSNFTFLRLQYHINYYYALSIVTCWLTQLRGLRQGSLFKKLKKYSLKEETGLIMILNSNENFSDLVET